jgi:hypothetical protein
VNFTRFWGRSGKPAFDHLEQDNRLRLVHFEEHSGVHINADEHHARVVLRTVA